MPRTTPHRELASLMKAGFRLMPLALGCIGMKNVNTQSASIMVINEAAAISPLVINPACFHVGLMAAQGRAAVGHQAD
ncbi:hypothetical protein, partial [Halomonas cupida]|uniref:hypothetical protein n=1 Tax=Halomonas cupida TaxID=44933 RepID=UPI003A935BF7